MVLDCFRRFEIWKEEGIRCAEDSPGRNLLLIVQRKAGHINYIREATDCFTSRLRRALKIFTSKPSMKWNVCKVLQIKKNKLKMYS